MNVLLCALLALLIFPSARGHAKPVPPAPTIPKKPSILLILIDDMGWGDLGCFGNPRANTVHIDRLAAEGLRFEQFCVNSPICSPSRAALCTGQYPQRWRVTSFLEARAANEKRGMAQWLDPQAPMLARFLHDSAATSYATGHFGKWHLGGQRDVGDAPLITEYGFDASLTNFEGLGDRVLPLLDAHDGQPAKKHALGSDRLGRGAIIWKDRSAVTTAYADRALDFIKQAEKDGRPFCVNLWPDDVHSPFFPPDGAARRGKDKREKYLSVLQSMDEQLAPLLDHLRSSPALRDNTLVLVCSDNGPEPGAGSAGPFRGTKGMLYEGGLRSPLIVWSPGLLAPGRAGTVNTTSFLAAIDLAPTLLSIAGVPAPGGVSFDGLALPDILLGRSDASRDKPCFFRRPPDRPAMDGLALPDLAVRDGAWKLLCAWDGTSPELYDLKTDRAEAANLAEQHPDIVQRLTSSLLAWHRSMPPDHGPAFKPKG